MHDQSVVDSGGAILKGQHKEVFCELIKLFFIVTTVMVTQIYACVKNHKTVHQEKTN